MQIVYASGKHFAPVVILSCMFLYVLTLYSAVTVAQNVRLPVKRNKLARQIDEAIRGAQTDRDPPHSSFPATGDSPMIEVLSSRDSPSDTAASQTNTSCADNTMEEQVISMERDCRLKLSSRV